MTKPANNYASHDIHKWLTLLGDSDSALLIKQHTTSDHLLGYLNMQEKTSGTDSRFT